MAQTEATRIPKLLSSLAGVVFLLQGCTTGQQSGTPPPALTGPIAQIKVTGQLVKVFDHSKDQQELSNIPDAPITAWREANGTVNLMIPSTETYRMRGPDLGHLTIDPHKIFSSTANAQQIPESLYNYNHWLTGPYSLDGKSFYTLVHSEWYACLLNGDCMTAAANGQLAQTNSWANTVNSLVSADGGASWQLNIVSGDHTVAKTAYVWTGSQASTQQVYLHALNQTGIFQPTRVIQESGYYYAIGYYLHRDFSKINPAGGVYEAPVDKFGYIVMRTNDVTNPNNWQAWTSGSTYEPISNLNFNLVVPQQNGTALNNAAPPQLIYDTHAQCYILIFTFFSGSNAVYFMTTKSLASPSWSEATAIVGTSGLVSDPAGAVTGFNAQNYVSLLDSSSTGYNFEFTSGNPQLFFSTFPDQYGGQNNARDVYSVQLMVSYQ